MYTQAMDTMGKEASTPPALRSAQELQLQERFDARIDAGEFIGVSPVPSWSKSCSTIRRISSQSPGSGRTSAPTAAVAGMALEHGGRALRVTMSLGVAQAASAVARCTVSGVSQMRISTVPNSGFGRMSQ
jgi:hypothetical protein